MHYQCEDIWLICIALVGLALHCFPSKCCSIARTIHRWSGCADTRIDSGVCPISPRQGAGPQLCDTALGTAIQGAGSPISPRHTGLVPNCAIQLLISTPICTNGDHRQQWGGSFAQILHKSCAYRAYLFRLSSRLCRCTTICILLILPAMKHISLPTRWK